MTEKNLHTIKALLKRTENLPDILHLRAAPIGYELTEADKELLLDTYQKLDDILKEVAAFINVKFPERQDYIQPWKEIDFDTKIGGIKIITTDREHTRSAWKKGIFDLKSLIKTLINEVSLLVDQEHNPLLSAKEWDKYFDLHLEKRADKADFFLDVIIERKLINLDKQTVRNYFKQWFAEAHNFDLQFEDGDFAIGDIQVVPNFSKDNIPEFLKWFEIEGNNFIDYLKEQGVKVKNDSKETIVNTGNLIINQKSKIKNQTINDGAEQKDSNWSKVNVIIALVVGIVTIAGIVWQIFS